MEKTINITIPISFKDIEDLLICAFEGGSNYWYDDLEPIQETSKLATASERFYDNLMTHGFRLKDKETGELHGVHIERYAEAVSLMQQKYTQHFMNWRSENYDAETGDVFLQLLVFKDVVYG
jgi:hypothetical protein